MVKPASGSAVYTASSYRTLLNEIGIVVSFTKGVSMWPLIKQGRNYVAIKPLEGEPKNNDILLFEQIRKGETTCILHRLIRKNGDVYVTRGDNCINCEYIRREDIIGKVTDIYKRGSEKHISVTDNGSLFYVRFWNMIWPVRLCLYKTRNAVAKVLKKILPKSAVSYLKKVRRAI